MSVVRFLISLILGNLFGLAFLRLALLGTNAIWSGVKPDASFSTHVLLIGLTAILFATPPVIIGALTALAARRAGLWAGIGSGLWSFGFAAWWPEPIPYLPPEAWLAPTMLVLLSGMVGGWLIDSHRWAGVQRTAKTALEQESS